VDGAEVIPEKNLTPGRLAERIIFYLRNPERTSAMERNLAVLKTEDPAGRIAGLCFELMKGKGR
jgi:UDP-N-acetylglucosamine:LPS N-acetylglucosamine transferase